MFSNVTKSQYLTDGVQSHCDLLKNAYGHQFPGKENMRKRKKKIWVYEIKQEADNACSRGCEESTETSLDYNSIKYDGGEPFVTKVQDTIIYKQEQRQINEEIDIKLEVPVKEEHKAMEIDPCSALGSPSIYYIKNERNMNTLMSVDSYGEQIDVKRELVPVKEESIVEINLALCSQVDVNGQKHVELDNQTKEMDDLNVTAKKEKKSQRVIKKVTKKGKYHEGSSPDDGSNVNTAKKKLKKKTNKKYDKKNHVCNTCGSAFTHDYYLVRHMTSHTGNKPFACKTCDKKFTQQAHLVQHLRVHTGEKPYACNICENKAFNHKYNYKTHMRKHFVEPSQKCNLCSSVFHRKGDLQRHMRTHTGERPFACNVCSASFAQNCHLTQHLRIHTKKKPFSFNFCEQAFAKKKHLNEHIVVHTDAELFSCSRGCEESTETSLDYNSIKYDGGEPFVTKVQDTIMYKQEQRQINEEIDIKLEVPVKEEHKAMEIDPCSALGSPSIYYIKNESNTNTLMSVDSYGEQIDVKRDLVPVKEESIVEINLALCSQVDVNGQKHVELDNQTKEMDDLNVTAKKEKKSQRVIKKVTKKGKYHEGSSPDDGSNVNTAKKKLKKKTNKKYDKKNHVCNTCGSAFTHDYYLVRHMTSHTGNKPFACKTCDKKFTQQAHLVQHLRVHTGEKPYACNICENKAFNHKYNYKTHMRKHFVEPSQKCNLCSSVFHQKGDLQRHMRTHTGERPFACNVCSASFAQNCHLTQHLRTHTKEKPFSCNFCEQAFAKKKHLNEHIVVHTDAELFSCSMEDCSKVFQTKSEFQNHLKYHARKQPYSCDKCNKIFKSKGPLTTHTVLVHDKKDIEENIQ